MSDDLDLDNRPYQEVIDRLVHRMETELVPRLLDLEDECSCSECGKEFMTARQWMVHAISVHGHDFDTAIPLYFEHWVDEQFACCVRSSSVPVGAH